MIENEISNTLIRFLERNSWVINVVIKLNSGKRTDLQRLIARHSYCHVPTSSKITCTVL